MKIIKLDAIDSTNSFLKEMAENSIVEDFTVVVAKSQTSGRGQMNAKWEVMSGKNLTFSVFCKFRDLQIINQKSLSYSVALSVFEVLNRLKLPKLSVKWPNDIMSGNKKIAGVLIENVLKGKQISSSIIGIGINVNQDSFPINLPNASSLKKILNKEFDLDLLLNEVILSLEKKIEILKRKEYSFLEKEYLKVLYKKNVPSMFKDKQNILFMGKIIGVSSIGKLQIELEDETVKEFDLKEVSFA
ncbi:MULTISPECIES: biotin--[acetyl-CoA-carboxylase] ligase [unclassified Tenacibaculum]|uniref:biotin--[acetyl-CoA-carboxylase] ligase n=1 Tax=unclassified Tenacibaculum TaxID=2635139 RepID=UPI001F1E6CA6|nr:MULTISPECIES: biotin--[acetyl-CoA-carboxylase] ligase [unclassified Tenacibaculum]MCF2876197.1 biotin--[acetyl-CoA-carboxylase] ligase [Tenacibaculum sp. Cn5-1]MCF2936272.1 biotin--[acetyl-CoA-carboxylase] ligase [Tenacibaculum sp. Cn5-34]MCG7511615.1 biotin--[acetyl-CoA-carboxylase] ligase [Tenacibaculum sp. Cn5-46]